MNSIQALIERNSNPLRAYITGSVFVFIVFLFLGRLTIPSGFASVLKLVSLVWLFLIILLSQSLFKPSLEPYKRMLALLSFVFSAGFAFSLYINLSTHLTELFSGDWYTQIACDRKTCVEAEWLVIFFFVIVAALLFTLAYLLLRNSTSAKPKYWVLFLITNFLFILFFNVYLFPYYLSNFAALR